MADQMLSARPALAALVDIPGQVTARVRSDLSLVHVAARRGQGEALRAAVESAYSLRLPDKPRLVAGKSLFVAWAGPDQWLAMAENPEGRDLERELRQALQGLASVADQTDGRAVVEIAGPRARDVLAKGVPIDLHPRVFEPGHVAITHASHIGIILWQADAAPTYALAMFRSFADSFAHWLAESAEEYGGA